MKKYIFAAALLMITAAAFSQPANSSKLQKPDTTVQHKADTVAVPVYIVDKTDTVQVQDLIYRGERNVVKWSSPGYIIRKYKVQTVDGKTYQPIIGPTGVPMFETVGALDDKKRPVPYFRQ